MSFCISDIIYSRRSVKIPSISYKWYFLFKFRSMTDLLLSSNSRETHTKPQKEIVDCNKNEDEDFSGNFSWLFYPHFLLRLAHWLAISNQLQRWMTSAAFQRLSMTQRKTLQKAFAQVYNRHLFSFPCKNYLRINQSKKKSQKFLKKNI